MCTVVKAKRSQAKAYWGWREFSNYKKEECYFINSTVTLCQADGIWCKEKLWEKHLFINTNPWWDWCFIFTATFFFNKGRGRSTREGAVKCAASPDIHSRCWLDLVEPGPVVLGAGFSCLFLQVWCLMLIPPHVPWVLSKHARAGDSTGRPALPPACLSLPLPSLVAHPHTLQQQQPTSPLLLTCHQSCCHECQSICKTEKPPFLWAVLFFHFLLLPLLQTSGSFWVWTTLTRAYVHTAAQQALLQAEPGQLLL